VLATVQAGVLLGAGVLFLDVEFTNGIVPFFLLEVLGALSALGLGIFVSLFAHNEFQVLQSLPVVIAPQIILGGVFLPVDELPQYLEIPARAMPLTYLLDGMNWVVLDRGGIDDFWLSVGVLGGFVVLSVILAGFVVRRAG
jgi:ABC-2 type transport system permease protein